jgi:hypothetical protein
MVEIHHHNSQFHRQISREYLTSVTRQLPSKSLSIHHFILSSDVYSLDGLSSSSSAGGAVHDETWPLLRLLAIVPDL